MTITWNIQIFSSLKRNVSNIITTTTTTKILFIGLWQGRGENTISIQIIRKSSQRPASSIKLNSNKTSCCKACRSQLCSLQYVNQKGAYKNSHLLQQKIKEGRVEHGMMETFFQRVKKTWHESWVVESWSAQPQHMSVLADTVVMECFSFFVIRLQHSSVNTNNECMKTIQWKPIHQYKCCQCDTERIKWIPFTRVSH